MKEAKPKLNACDKMKRELTNLLKSIKIENTEIRKHLNA